MRALKTYRIMIAIPLLIACVTGSALAEQTIGGRVKLSVLSGTPGQLEVIPDQIVVRFRAHTPQQVIDTLHAAHGVQVLKSHSRSGLQRLALPPGAARERILEAYRRHPLVEEAGLNYIVRGSFLPNDTNYTYQWHMKNTTGGMWAEGAWDLSPTKGQGVIVAVIDSGVAYENFAPFTRAPDLQHKTFVSPWDFFNNEAHANDDNGHGTHVTGTIAQDTNSNPPYGVAGIAYNSIIMPLKVLNYDGSGLVDDLVEALHYAIDHDAHVINLSLGIAGSGTPDASGLPCTEFVGLKAALDRAYVNNVVVVAAAGNEAATTVSCPAAYPTVIAVGATRFDGQIASYSNSGAALDITAPGGDLSVDQDGDGYGDGVLQETFCYDWETMRLSSISGINLYDQLCDVWYSGTSMASAHVAGTVALLLAEDPSLTPDKVRCYLEATARDRGAPGWDASYGWGALDARAALNALQTSSAISCPSSPLPPPPPTITGFTPTIGVAGTAVTITGTNFAPFPVDNTVRFNTVQAVVNSATATATSTTVPAGARSGRISVTTPDGQAVSTGDFFVPIALYIGTDVAFTRRMAIGGKTAGTIGTANKIGLVVFDGEAGQRVSLGMWWLTNTISPNNSCRVSLYNPDGTVLVSGGVLYQGALAAQLPVTGTYTILIDPAGVSTGSIILTLSLR